jgi:hypothetical protein
MSEPVILTLFGAAAAVGLTWLAAILTQHRYTSLPHKTSPMLAPDPPRLTPTIGEARRRLPELVIPACVIAAMCIAGLLSSLWGGHVLATMVLTLVALTVAALACEEIS